MRAGSAEIIIVEQTRRKKVKRDRQRRRCVWFLKGAGLRVRRLLARAKASHDRGGVVVDGVSMWIESRQVDNSVRHH